MDRIKEIAAVVGVVIVGAATAVGVTACVLLLGMLRAWTWIVVILVAACAAKWAMH